MNYTLVSSQEIIARVWRDFRPGSSTWVTDAVEWIGDVLDRLGGAPCQPKTVTLGISSFRVSLPCDLAVLDGVEYNGVRLSRGTDRTGYSTPSTPRTSSWSSGDNGAPYYLLSPGTLITSFEEGEIRLHYRAFPLDADGYPLLPNNPYLRQACFWYVLGRLALRGDTTRISFEECDRKYETQLRLADNDISFPDLDQMENLRASWVRLIPETGYPTTFGLGSNSFESR